MSTDTLDSEQRSRRALLAAAAGSAAALVAGSLVRPSSADAASAALMTEVDNATDATTSITSSVNGETSVGFATTVGDQATALQGRSPGGIGVQGTNDASGAGVVGDSGGSVGVFGRTGDPNGFPGIAGTTAGVAGYSGVEFQPGVFGSGDIGVEAAGSIGAFAVGAPALVGIGDGLGPPGQFGSGIYGYSGSVSPPEPPDNVGVYARGDGTAVALKVQGKTAFSRSGRSYISSGGRSRSISVAGLTSANLVLVTLQTYRSGVYLAAAVPTTGKFTVYLNKTVTGTTYFAWFIIN